MNENQPLYDDRREPTDWEETVGKDPITAGDKAQLQEALEAMRRAQSADAPSGPERARAALEEAKLRKGSPSASAPRSDNPALRLSDKTVETGKRGIAETRKNRQKPTSPQ